MPTPIKQVTLVGANGDLGTVVLETLAAVGSFRVTALRREGSSSTTQTYPASVRVVTVPAAWDESDLSAALKGEDAVIACFPVAEPPTAHLTLANAAAAAGVARFIPADFGSVDARSQRAQELVPLFKRKVVVRERLEELAAASAAASSSTSNPSSSPGSSPFTWTSIVCGHFFDWGLRAGFLHVDLLRRKTEILDDGEARSSLSTLAQVGRAIVAVLQKPEQTTNRLLFVQSFCVSQNQLLAALEKATGTDWKKEFIPSKDFIAKYVAMRDEGDRWAIEDLVFALGVIEGNWEGKDGFAMDILELKEESLGEVVQRVVDEIEEARSAQKEARLEAMGQQTNASTSKEDSSQ